MEGIGLPAELWIYIFQLAVDDTPLLDLSLPTSLADSSWQKMVYGNWTLRTPQESFNVLLRQRYSLLKVGSLCIAYSHHSPRE